jgi:hypothetical protein
MTLYRRCLLSVLAAIALPMLPADPAAAANVYVDAREHPNQAAGWERFRRVEAALVRDFDQICGDTFCEGEYGNLQPQRFRCSVHAASGIVHECVWTFAGSTARVDEASGEVVVDSRSWACVTPLSEQTPLFELLATLEGPDPIDTPLPGTQTTIYEGLTDCL